MGRNWYLLWSGSAISALGDGIFLAALPLLATTITQDPKLIAGVSFFGALPWLLAALPAGAAADRFDGRRLLLAALWVQCALMALLAVFHSAHIAFLYGMAFLIGTAENVPRAVGQPLIKATVDNHLLERANGRLFASQAVALQFVGPPLGGLLFVIAVPAPFWVNALTFAVAALLVSRMRTERKVPAARPKAREGLRWLLKHKALRTITVVSATTNLCIAMTMATLVLFAQQRLGLSGAGFGAFLATLACGGVAGGLLAERLLARYRNTVTATVVLIPLMWLGIATLAHDLVTVAAFAVVSSFCTAVWGVATSSFRQRVVPTELLGRVSSAQTLVTWGVQPVGALLGGLTADSFGLLAPWYVAVTLRTAVGLLSLKSLRAHVRVSTTCQNRWTQAT
ncbi:Predicted arabinose efflux permease, MFS family [Lentzea albidocapillata subsp. violacea]|uniref:Predicted arabinose efflux permease, MFS family n=1 Tax=Lentzea albidocapillata subsp. violacea TaxID=128104 RepID=A0A1G9VLB0_9PSEU|nr:MFS transporter [Lentzea albidocapillata]SDM72853.1 Predicted arabinose efflux permease, MFS family [Lentzea albidocapillata subsp. violacea]